MAENHGDDQPTHAVPTRPTDEVAIIAHRGFAGRYPENTRAAMRGASGTGSGDARVDDDRPNRSDIDHSPADAIEIDVRPAAGGELVVFHDAHLGRLTDVPKEHANRAVWETSIERLRKLDVLDSGEQIPLFTEVMDTIPPEIGVNVELKPPGKDAGTVYEFGSDEQGAHSRERAIEPWREMVGRVRDVVADHENHVLLSSSYEGALAAAREVAPALPIAYLFPTSLTGGLEITRRYDCEALHPPYTMIANTPLFNSGYRAGEPFVERDLVEIGHEEGRAVNVWTLTNWHQATHLRTANIDGIITDYPELREPITTDTSAMRTDHAEETRVENTSVVAELPSDPASD